ncbi:MAG: Rpn family recombination-promoting nuclease/putative transposase [Spirochaetales bacterium]|nr:Rpn family recombination-promoting nuclease/putative transposase [Spirochaetales bacterium]
MRNYHDKYYKRIFSVPIFVEKLLTSFVHEEFVNFLDFKTLKKINKSFVTKKFKYRESDLIYEIYYKDRPFYIYLLLEFQSTNDKKMPLRFLRYILELYEDHDLGAGNKNYPALFPLLLYNGEIKWSAKINIADTIEHNIPNKYIPHFEYYPILINEIDKSELLKINNAVSAIFYMENTSSIEYHKAIDDLVLIIKDSSIIEVKVFAKWVNHFFIHNGLELNDNDYTKILNAEEALSMMAAEIDRYKKKLLDEGKLEGKLEQKITMAKKLLKEGAEIDFVVKITELSKDEIIKLKI